jgi:hypothetical protein
MANRQPTILSKNAYAKYLGVSEKAIRKAVTEGKIVKGWDSVNLKIIVKEADKEYGALHKVDRPRPGVSKAKLAAKIEASQNAEKSDEKPKHVRTDEKKSESPKTPKVNSEPVDEDSSADDGQSVEDLLTALPIHSKLSYTEATRRREVISLAMDKKKLEEQEGLLVRKADVEKVLFAFGNQLKKNVLAIPARTIDAILSAPTKVEALNVLTEEITATLDQFASFQTIKISKN